MTKYYPVNLKLDGKKCVVIGGGAVAERKAKRLVDCGARVLVISPGLTRGLKKLAERKKIKFKKGRVNSRDLAGAYLIISAAGNRKVNSSVSSYCRQKGILINVVDAPKECNFILPSVIRQGDLTITISTEGISPALSKKIREELEKKFGIEYARFLRIMKRLRPEVIKRIREPVLRKDFFNKAASAGIFRLLRGNKARQARQKLERLLKNKKIWEKSN